MNLLPKPKIELQKNYQLAWKIILYTIAVLTTSFIFQIKGTIKDLLYLNQETKGASVKGADGRGYYAWLRCPLVDGNLSFENDFQPLFKELPTSESAFPINKSGSRSNPWSIGPAITWAPSIVPLHIFLKALGDKSPWKADGFSPPYQIAVGLTTFFLCIFTIIIGFLIGCIYAEPISSAVAVSLLSLGTPLIAYGTVEVSMAHAPAAAALSLFIFFWLKTFDANTSPRWLILGSLLGLASLMRWQLTTFATVLVIESLWRICHASTNNQRLMNVVNLAIAGICWIVVFFPQIMARQAVYGAPHAGLHNTSHNWLNPSFWTVLFSSNKGFFYWTPITLPAMIGLAWLLIKRPAIALLGLLVSVAIQIWAISALIGNDVFLGWSFGFRFLTEICILLVPGLAFLIESIYSRYTKPLCIACGIIIGWNILLLGVFRHCLGIENGAYLFTMVAYGLKYFLNSPIEAISILAAVICWILAVFQAFSTKPDICLMLESTKDNQAAA